MYNFFKIHFIVENLAANRAYNINPNSKKKESY
jgi:hypothetical protein